MPFLNKLYKITWLITLCLLTSCSEDAKDARNAQFSKYLGTSTANINVLTLDSENITLSEMASAYGEKPIILNVWATWCPPCIKELPSLDRLAASGNYTVIALTTDKKAATVKNYLQKQPWGANLKILHDPAGKATYSSIGARALPMTYILNQNLTIKGIEAGERDWDSTKMRTKIKKYLK